MALLLYRRAVDSLLSVRIVVIIALLAGGAGCSQEDPDVIGYPVEKDDACHQLQLEQCQCCEDGEPNCTAAVISLVTKGTAWTQLSVAECASLLQAAVADRVAFCAELAKSDATLQLACQYFPPGSGPTE